MILVKLVIHKLKHLIRSGVPDDDINDDESFPWNQKLKKSFNLL